MKTKLENIALEGTCNGDVVGGLLSWAEENLQALLFLQKGGISKGKKKGLSKKGGICREFPAIKDSPGHNNSSR